MLTHRLLTLLARRLGASRGDFEGERGHRGHGGHGGGGGGGGGGGVGDSGGGGGRVGSFSAWQKAAAARSVSLAT